MEGEKKTRGVEPTPEEEIELQPTPLDPKSTLSVAEMSTCTTDQMVYPDLVVQEKEALQRLSTGELSLLLNVQATAIKKALRKGDRHFSDYCFEKCGKRFKPINVAKPGAKIPRWVFEEII